MLSTGSALPTTDKTQDWQPALTFNEDGLLHQLNSTLVQAIEASKCTLLHIGQLNVIFCIPSLSIFDQFLSSDKFLLVYVFLQPSCLFLICNSPHNRLLQFLSCKNVWMLSLNTKDYKHWLKESGLKVCFLKAVFVRITLSRGSEVDRMMGLLLLLIISS